jgi:hypothetical protein
MLHHRTRVTGLIALLALLVLAPGASAAAPAKASKSANAKERAYGKHCGSKRKKHSRAGQRAKCLDAMSRLATGRSTSPESACRALSHKKAGGERKSAYAVCVSAGAKLLKSKRGKTGGASGGDDARDDPEPADDGVDDGASVDDVGPLDETDGDDEPDPDDDSA